MTRLVVAPRVPRSFFLTSGTGQSDVTVHAGSFHLALNAAGLGHANIMTYSSVLPAGAHEVDWHSRRHRHGEVLECIMAQANCTRGQTATAGIAYGWLRDDLGDRAGGIVAEYGGLMPAPLVPGHLRSALTEVHRGGWGNLELTGVSTVTATVTADQAFGTALVALAFTDYVVEVMHDATP